MLQKLCIGNVALIDELDMEFSDGLNILTGETGAGKSIVIDAVNLVLGERASRELIKHGAQKARVEAHFSDINDKLLEDILEENGIERDDDSIILSREISTTGKNLCRINGTLISLAVLKSVSDRLIDIHGQHEHQTLLNPATHIDFLDFCAEAETLAPAKAATQETAANYHKLLLQGKTVMMSDEERARETDLLSYQINEIEAAKFQVDEEEALLKERSLLMNAEKIMTAMESGYALLNEDQGILQRLQTAKRDIEGIGSFDQEYEALASRMADAYYALEDISYTLRDCKNDFEFDAERLNEIERRLDLIALFKRKYGESIPAILQYCEKAKEKLQALANAAAERETLQKRIKEAADKYLKAAKELSAIRKAAAEKLQKQMILQLAEVGMPKACFSVEFSKQDAPLYSPNGEDQMEFLLSANPGEPLKPLAKVASGGELSRIMLAFKTIIADRDEMPTLIFDEIDTGISGKMASVVGEKMVSIAGKHQILCVTHLPQIAAMADVHYLLEKKDDGQSTHTNVRRLNDAESISRLSAMMSGEADSELGREHAKELLLASRKDKERLRKSGDDKK